MERKSYRQLNAKKRVSHAQMMTLLDAMARMNAKKLKMTMNKMLLFVTNQQEQAKLKLTQGAKSIKRQIHLSHPSKRKLLTLVSQRWEKIWLLEMYPQVENRMKTLSLQPLTLIMISLIKMDA